MYITDLDNTFLDKRGLLSDYSKAMLKDVMDDIDITFATARSIFTAGVVWNFVDFRLPFIVLNGAGIVDPKTLEYLKVFPIKRESFNKVINLSEDITNPFVVSVVEGKEKLFHKKPILDIHKSHLESRLKFNDTRQTLVEDYPNIDTHLCLTFVESYSLIKELEKLLEDVEGIVTYFHAFNKKGTDYCTLDVMSIHASKGKAVRELCKMLDIDLKDTVSFGDDVNDISMFEVTEKAYLSEVSSLKLDLPVLRGDDAVMKFIIKDSVKINEVFEMKDIDELVNESHQDFQFVRRLRDEYTSGLNPFNLKGECLFMSFIGNRVIGTCGLNTDPYLKDESVGRVRHMYVLKSFRRLGLASDLVQEVIKRGKINYNLLTLRTFSEEASKLYIKNGFTKTDRVDYATHIME